MNTNPKALTALCYGDSNVYGRKPDKVNRYAADVRWPGVLQQLLGDAYYVIEEGLGGRTTDLEDESRPGRNGKAYLEPCLDSHGPLDVVILMLGVGDLKFKFNRSVQEIGQALKGIVDLVKQRAKNSLGEAPKIILVGPVAINTMAPRFAEFYIDYYDNTSVEKSTQLSKLTEDVAGQTGCTFVDAAAVAQTGEDGLHFDEASHPALGKLLAEKIKEVSA